MRGEGTLGAQIVRRGHDAATEDLLPEAVHGHPGREGVFVQEQPLRQSQPVPGKIIWKREDGFRRVPLHGIAGLIVLAAVQEIGGTRLRQFPHHHDFGRVREDAVLAGTPTPELAHYPLPFGGPGADDVVPPLIRTRVLTRERPQFRKRQSTVEDLPLIERDLVQHPLIVVRKPEPQVTRSRPVGGVPGEGVDGDARALLQVVRDDPGGEHLSVENNIHARSPTGSIVAKGQVMPLSGGHRFFRADPDLVVRSHVNNPGRDGVVWIQVGHVSPIAIHQTTRFGNQGTPRVRIFNPEPSTDRKRIETLKVMPFAASIQPPIPDEGHGLAAIHPIHDNRQAFPVSPEIAGTVRLYPVLEREQVVFLHKLLDRVVGCHAMDDHLTTRRHA